ncbi:uncharacterized protein LOC129591247 [Paramacrobiotus metropolitanus]|uniref:uncharacterized protein LOC129591247 n=1 Tax=Paramacrobiotus metropolitanus TaxID=2943436 RepID=UPI00244617DA|nr:uncharacterized protein LOC129591247 [Paramacrobiotus metropolitanus]
MKTANRVNVATKYRLREMLIKPKPRSSQTMVLRKHMLPSKVLVSSCILLFLFLSRGIPAVDHDEDLSQPTETVVSESVDEHADLDILPELEPEEQWPTQAHFSADPNDWPGNGQPLGQTAPSFSVDRVKSFPPRKTFIDDYAIPAMPLVVAGAFKDTNIEKNWPRDSFFTTNAFAALHRVNATGPSKNTEELSLREFFLRKSWDTAIEMETTIPDFMRIDFSIPVSVQCKAIIEELQEAKLRMSASKKTNVIPAVSNLDRLVCVAKGKKNVFLVNGNQVHRDSNFTVTLEIDAAETFDFDSVDLRKIPGLRFAKFYKAELAATDCLYIPAKWTQFVKISSNFIEAETNWIRKTIDSSDKICGAVPTGKMTLGLLKLAKEPEIDLNKIMTISPLQLILNAVGQKNFTFDQMQNWLKKDKKLLQKMTEWNDEYEAIAGELFLLLDLNRDAVFSADDLDLLQPAAQALFLGRLHDRMQDFMDIMTDQQADLAPFTGKAGAGGAKLSPEIKEYLEKYNQDMKKLIADAVAEKEKQEKGEQQPDAKASTDAQNSSRKRPDRPKVQCPEEIRDDVIMEDTAGSDTRTNNRENYEEEILAEDDDELGEVPGVSRTPTPNPNEHPVHVEL